MPRFAANISLMYIERPFLDRFEAAARDGFKAVEYLSPYNWPAARLKAHGLQQGCLIGDRRVAVSGLAQTASLAAG